MESSLTNLPWLPSPSPDISKLLKAVFDKPQPGRELQALAMYDLEANQLTRLAGVLSKLRAAGTSLQPLVPFKLAILSNATLDLVVPAIIASGARHGIDLEVILPAFDQVAQEALNPESVVNRSNPDAVLIAIDYRALPLKTSFGDEQAADATVSGVMGYLKTLRDGIRGSSNAICIFQTFAPPVETLFGSLDVALPGTIRSLINGINGELARFVLRSGDSLLDVASVASNVGLSRWHDPQQWNMAKFPFADEFIPLFADHVARLVAAIRGKSRKVLVLDLDNTVWGGVIGDDGLEGIKISQGDASGESHLAVQRMALELRSRGIVLAVSSKNTDEVARKPFQEHPEMLLKLDHIAVFQANWNDKATNMQAIAQELNVGLDSLVFLDDNPVERGLMRRLLPEVAVPELPEEPAFYARTLAAAGYFEAATFASEDLKRADYYQDNSRRVSLQNQVGGVDAYLASLDMSIIFQPFDATGRARIVQLINKSNQYNLTTRRYTEPEVAMAELAPEVFTLQVRLLDMFGDNGMISVVICRPGERNEWEIDTWLMSCRVLGRRVEHMVLREIAEHARSAGIEKLIGVYRPTVKNKLVLDHFARLGFVKQDEDSSGVTRWAFALDSPLPDAAPMKVSSHGFIDMGHEVTV